VWNKHYRTRRIFENGYSYVIDPSQTRFFKALMASQNNEISINIPRHFADFQCGIGRQALKGYIFQVL
jgi:hypothetical protein